MNYELFSHPEQKKNIYLIDMTREHGYFSEMVQKGIEKYIKEQKKILLIINKKGFASGLLCTSCGHIPQCHNCSVSIGYHTTENNKSTHQHNTNSLIGLCHICKTIYELPQYCPQCHKSDSLKLYGLTLQKTEQRIQQEFDINPLIIQSETVASSAKIQRLLPELEKAKVVIGTNIIIPHPRSLSVPEEGCPSLTGEENSHSIQKNKILNHHVVGVTSPEILQRARDLRKNMTSAEKELRSYLSGEFFKGIKRRRQHPIVNYILDFCTIEYKIIIEVDGSIHNTLEQQIKDKERDEYFTQRGFYMLRFSNIEIVNNIKYVLQKIQTTIDIQKEIINKVISPLPAGRGVGVRFDLVVMLAADQSLGLPDYSVRQDTFVQLHNIIQHTNAPTVLVQSYDTQHDSIRDACKLDRDGFMKKEKIFRQSHYYPPYGELCVIKYKNENETTLHNSIQALTKELLYLQQNYEYPDLTIYATPPLVYKKFGKFYYHIIILGPQDHVRPFMDIAFSKLQMRKRGFKIDWMANHIV